MTVRELREKYLRFFESKGHQIYPSGSLVPYDVTGRLDESLLFNGAGMVQFKPFFRGVAQPPQKRLTNAQKCVRTGDIEDVGDLSHLTFFEMLGNFSFGDYFKEEAIAFSWEFLTSPEWLGLDKNRLSFTVFHEDDLAFECWSKHLREAGVDPTIRVFRLGEETNYWPAGAFTAGPPGPCGPNSEMFYWVAETPPPTSPYTTEDWLKDDDAKNWLEIWKDVFIQFEWQGQLRNLDRPSDGYEKTGMPNLPFNSVDTGMGLERTAAVLGGHKSVYDTDAFTPIIKKIEEIASNAYTYGADATQDHATRIISDHIRTACFCIADGVLPGNSGRGYVLRRLIRRAVLKGQRVLGFSEPFFHRVYEGVLESMGGHYKELVERQAVIVETLRNEEALFRRIIASGSEMLQDELERLQAKGSKVLLGELAFKLYDTYGFPLEVTRELCAEAGIEVDEAGYETALKEAQDRSRGGQDRDSVYGGVGGTIVINLFAEIEEPEQRQGPTPTKFVGYDTTQTQTKVAAAMALRDLPGNEDAQDDTTLMVALVETPFYAESGGQVSDYGTLAGSGFEGRVTGVIKQEGVYVHEVEPIQMPVTEPQKLFNLVVEAEVDHARRARVVRNHTATHLLHAALRQVLGKHVTQAGSYVGPDRLRFDFTHGAAMTEEQKTEVEKIVNEKALENLPVVIYNDLPIDDAKAMGAMALFGEKYGNTVRMVQVGPEPPNQPSFSRELCGGIHVRTTGEIGLFKIVSESSAASGVRRIEALTGEGAYEWVLEQSHLLKEAADKLKSTPKDLVHAIEKQIEAQRDLKQKLEKARTQGAAQSQAQVIAIGDVELAIDNIGEGEQAEATLAADRLVDNKPNRVALTAVIIGERALFVCKVGKDALAKGAHAGNLLREVAKVAEGGGGGKPDFATAGGKNIAKVPEALAAAEAVLRGMIG